MWEDIAYRNHMSKDALFSALSKRREEVKASLKRIQIEGICSPANIRYELYHDVQLGGLYNIDLGEMMNYLHIHFNF